MNRSGKTILIIDDDSRNIFALTAVLKAKGYVTASAGSMKEAFELLGWHENIGVILIDMMMPDMDGYEAIPLLKADQRYKHIPVVAVTAQAMTGDREKCLAAGADAYQSKPVDVDQLMEILAAYL
ncbi:response regulator [Telluribacter sp. SYSU D00476]|uniref:response regulator n=1 Tax=Telluribacter sp. SYSU D00476 TaxID=2811430 RepID=UPI001FF26788|nr:response regulator [Telluribacter sp. SYSU D00476]